MISVGKMHKTFSISNMISAKNYRYLDVEIFGECCVALVGASKLMTKRQLIISRDCVSLRFSSWLFNGFNG